MASFWDMLSAYGRQQQDPYDLLQTSEGLPFYQARTMKSGGETGGDAAYPAVNPVQDVSQRFTKSQWDELAQWFRPPPLQNVTPEMSGGKVMPTQVDPLGAGAGLGLTIASMLPIPGAAGAKAAGKAASVAKRMTDVPDIRRMPVEEAIALARGEPHLIPAGAGTEGAFVGGPRDVQSKADLNKIRRNLDKFIAQDPRGWDWYNRYRAGVANVTGNDPAANTFMAQTQAGFSPGVAPEIELQFALREANAALAGEPVKAARPEQHKQLMAAIAANDPMLMARGEKTGEYGFKINPLNAAAARTAVGTNDFRHQVNLGFKLASGELPSATAGQIMAPSSHRFMDYETALAVDRANKANLGGRSDWTGEQIQAAPWVRQKALATQRDRPDLTHDEAFKVANTTIADFFPKHTAAATYEALPGSATGHLPGLQAAETAAKDAYALDPRSSWATAPGGRDAIYSEMRHPDVPGLAMRVRPSANMQGIYTNDLGALELNRGGVAQPLVAFKMAGTDRSIAPADRKILEAGELLRAYIDAQNAGAAHMNFASKKMPQGVMGSVHVPLDQPLTRDQAVKLRDIGERYGLGDVVDRGSGVTMTNFMNAPAGAETAKNLRAGLVKDLAEVLPGTTPARVKTEGVYQSLIDEWKAGEGSGAATTKLLATLDKTPTLREGLDRSTLIPQKALANLERDAEAAGNDVLRADIQNARRIIGEGPGWITRLQKALDRGEYLPALAGPVLLSALGERTPPQ